LTFLSSNSVSENKSGDKDHSKKSETSLNVFSRLFKKNYPIFLAEAFITFSVSGILLTMVATSRIIFPNESFRPLEMGFIISARTWSVAFAGLGLGILSDRIPRKPIFIAILVLAGVGRLINGFAPAGGEDLCYIFFILCNIVVGFGQGGLMPATISYVDDAISPDLRSRFFGLYEMFRQTSQIFGMILCAWMFQIGLWREYFWITCVMLFACAGMVAFIIREPKRGSSHDELKQVLANDAIQYRYRMTKDVMRTTLFSPTNIMIFIEGIFTWIIFSISLFLMYPYLQNPPYNISPLITSIMMSIFGLPGAIIGSIAFSRISDKLAMKDVMYRINLIVFSIVVLFFAILFIFLLPFPHLTPQQGNDLPYLMTMSGFLGIGMMLFAIRSVLSIYHINQTPIIQNVNLPEAQGTVSAWNQFLETIGMGLGPMIAAILLTIYDQNYLITAVLSLLIGLPSAFLWLLTRRWIHHDIARIKEILNQRAVELGQIAKS